MCFYIFVNSVSDIEKMERGEPRTYSEITNSVSVCAIVVVGVLGGGFLVLLANLTELLQLCYNVSSLNLIWR